MRRFLAIAALCALASTLYARAADRIIYYPQQTLPSTTLNQAARSTRLQLGTWILNALGSAASGGVYANLSVVPGSGLDVLVHPTLSGSDGALYQIAQNDPTALPASGTPHLVPDTTLTVVQGLQNGVSGTLGPMTAPTTGGQSVYYLVEAQLRTSDTTPVNTSFVNSSGQHYSQTVNTVRADQIVYQLKAGAAAVSPTVPSVDSGWIGIGTVLIPFGAGSITSGMIAALPAFNGFVPANAAGGLSATSVSNAKNGICNLSSDFHAYGDDTHDDSSALNAALAAWQAGTCGTIVLDAGKTYLIDEALEPAFSGTPPYQKPLRITSDGAAWNGYWNTISTNGSGALDLRYDGTDGLHPAKIDTRGAGMLEIDHVTLEDKGSDNLLFLQTTNTTIHVHDDAFIGNLANSGATCTQDAIRLGADGYSTTGSITSGTNLLTINSGAFSASMVGWSVTIGGVGTYTIASYVGPTQVTISSNAGATVSNTPVNYYGTKTSDAQAPFQGYGSVMARNYYSHIARGVIWGLFANNVTVEDETYANNSGSSLTYGAPYYFDSTTSVQDGNIIRGGTVEITGYPYLVSMQGFQHGNTFSGIGVYDHNGYTQGVYYFGGNAYDNTVIEGQVDSTLNPVLSVGPAASLNTIVSSGLANIPSSFQYAVNAAGPIGRGHAFQIDGHDVLYSDSNGLDNNLNLAAPGSSGIVNFLNGAGTAAQINAHILEIDGKNAVYGNGGTALVIASQGSGGAINFVDPSATPAPVTMGALSATSLNTTATTNTLNTWHFNPTATTDFYIGSTGTTAATVHFRTNGYSNTDVATVDSTGAWKPGSSVYGPTSATINGQIHAAVSATCTASSSIPCVFSWSCTMSAGSCTATQAVPASATCTLEPNVSPVLSSTNVAQHWATLSSTTLTVHVQDMLGASTASLSGVGTCL